MSTLDKLLQRMRNSPAGDWTIADVDRLLTAYGCDKRNHGSSHYAYFHPKIADLLTVPYHRPIKPKYIRLVVEFVDRIEEITVKGGVDGDE